MNLLTNIVELAIEDALASDRAVQKPWLTQQVVLANLAEGDSDFAKACAYQAVAEEIGRVMRRNKERTEKADEQLVLPGYSRIQSRYQIDRGGVATLVPIALMTLKEGLGKASELDAHAKGAAEHARELVAYFQAREEQRKAGRRRAKG